MSKFKIGDKVRHNSASSGTKPVTVSSVNGIYFGVKEFGGLNNEHFFELVKESNPCITTEVVTKRKVTRGSLGCNIGLHPLVGSNMVWLTSALTYMNHNDLRDLAKKLVEVADVLEENAK